MEPKAQSVDAGNNQTRFIRRERQVAALARRQYGVVAKGQLTALGLGDEAIKSRRRLGRLRSIHRGVYVLGQAPIPLRGRWLAAVLALGEGALLSHRSAAALWGLIRLHRGPVEVTSPRGRSSRREISLHQGALADVDRAVRDGIPVTSVPRTLVDLAGILDGTGLRRAFEEADRLRLLDPPALARACDRVKRRRGVAELRHLVEEARAPSYPLTPLEDQFAEFCRAHLGDLPPPATNVLLLGHEVDALWPKHRVAVEMDSWEFHRHRAAFERDRARDTARQAAGYRVLRLTHRRLVKEPRAVASQLRKLLADS